MKTTNKFLRICPKCGGSNVKSLYLMSPIEQARFFVHIKRPILSPQNFEYYGCLNCGNYGIFPEIKISEIKAFKENLKKLKK